jgi:hypothetical protein
MNDASAFRVSELTCTVSPRSKVLLVLVQIFGIVVKFLLVRRCMLHGFSARCKFFRFAFNRLEIKFVVLKLIAVSQVIFRGWEVELLSPCATPALGWDGRFSLVVDTVLRM